MLCCLACWLPSRLQAQSAERKSPAPSSETQAPRSEAPKILLATPAEFPAGALAQGKSALVVLEVTLDAEGKLVSSEVVESAGALLDDEAQRTLRRWTFAPALQEGRPVASSVRVEVPFRLPEYDLRPPAPGEDAKPAPQPAAAAPRAPPAARPAAKPKAAPAGAFGAKAVVRSASDDSPRSTSDFTLQRPVLEAAPHRDAGDLLMSAPGVYTSRPEGDAVGHRISLRGFDAEHGQDIEFTAAGIPLNQPSHIHGQGYTDLGFLPVEVIRSLRVSEGVYDPRQGDFAVAGSIDFDLGVVERGVHSHSAYGSFDTYRQSVVWAPKGEAEETFGAFVFQRSSGFGSNRASRSGSAMAQYAFGQGRTRGILHLSLGAARAGLAGVVRKDDIDSGRVGFYDSYPFPTAESQSGYNSRAQLSLRLDHRGQNNSLSRFTLWSALNDFRLRSNFTGFTQRSRTYPDFVGRGDLIEQSQRSLALGLRAEYRAPEHRPAPSASGFSSVGMAARVDLFQQAQNLLEAPQNQTWDRRVGAAERSRRLARERLALGAHSTFARRIAGRPSLLQRR
mgnify:FL=1